MSPPIMREKFQAEQTVNVFNKITTAPNATNIYKNNSTFSSPVYTLSSAGNINVYTPIQSTHKEKHFIHFLYTTKMPILAGIKHLSVYFFFHRSRLFHLSTEKSKD